MGFFNNHMSRAPNRAGLERILEDQKKQREIEDALLELEKVKRELHSIREIAKTYKMLVFDQYEAARRGPDGIRAYAALGGTFDDKLDSDGNMAVLYAMDYGPEAIRAFGEVGGKFTDACSTDGHSAQTYVISRTGDPVGSIRAFHDAGGDFTFAPNGLNETAGMAAVYRDAMTIRAYVRAGGKFNDHANDFGMSAEIFVSQRGAESMRAYAEGGGKFTDHQDVNGRTSAMIVAEKGPEEIRVYRECGGTFSNIQNNKGQTAGMLVLNCDSGDGLSVDAYVAAGGTFGDQIDIDGRDCAMYAVGKTGAKTLKAYVRGGGSVTGTTRDNRGRTLGICVTLAGAATIDAFVEAGGVFRDDQDAEGYTAAMNAVKAVYDPEEAIRAYARAGGIFSDKKNKFGETVAMMVGFKSAKVIEAFAESGGIFEETPDELADRAYMSRRGMLDPEHLEAYTKAYNAQKKPERGPVAERHPGPEVLNP